MNKKIIPIALAVLISLAVFVSAYMTGPEYGPYTVEVELREGWNIVAGTILEDGISEDSEIQLNDVEAMWYYSPLQKEYIRIHPNPDWDEIMQDDEDFVLNNAMWLYSNKDGTIKYSTLEEYPPLNLRQLYSGWNFVVITENMYTGVLDGSGYEDEYFSWDSIKGDCDYERIYSWNPATQEWTAIDSDLIFKEYDFDDFLGNGMLVKVTNDCNLGAGTGGDGTSPPPLPNGGTGEGECTDTDSGIDYDTRGGVEKSSDVLNDVCIEDPEFTSNDLDYYINAGIITSEQAEDPNLLLEAYCSGDSIEIEAYSCPNGCVYGKCREVGECILYETNEIECSYNGVDYDVKILGGCGVTETEIELSYEGKTETVSIMQGEQTTLENGVVLKNNGAPCGFPINNLKFE